MADDFREGDHWVISDRTGRRIRASEARKEWTGAIVGPDEYEPRHPQDFVRSLADTMRADPQRPRPPALNVGPASTSLTAAAAAGATSLEVASTADFAVGNAIVVMIDTLDRHRATVATVVDATHLTISPALPWSAAVGRAVINNSTIA